MIRVNMDNIIKKFAAMDIASENNDFVLASEGSEITLPDDRKAELKKRLMSKFSDEIDKEFQRVGVEE